MNIFVIMISSMLVSNVVLSQFLGICPFLGVSKKVETAAGMGAAVTFVITIASAITYPIYYFILEPLGLEYLETIAFILIIAALVQFVEMVLKKFMPPLYEALGVFLPLITTNCAVLGVAINNITNGLGFIESVLLCPPEGCRSVYPLCLLSGAGRISPDLCLRTKRPAAGRAD